MKNLQKIISAGALLLTATVAQADGRPNIVFILADDLGPDGVNCYGAAEYAGLTPRIDALAAEGIRFTRAHGGAICSPARAQYLTGQYPFENGVLTNGGNNYLDTNKPIVSAAMAGAGYTTGAVGKDADDTFTYYENGERMVFLDEYLASGTGAFWNYKKYDQKGPSPIDPSPENYPYFPDAMHAWALDFMERHYPREENDYKPFYLFYSMIHPHGPFHPTPDSEPGTEGRRELYADYLEYTDKLVGGVIDKLAELGQLDNTLLVFTGDNGAQGGFQGDLIDPRTGEVRKISGKKSDDEELREGTTLVPLIAHWPQVITEPSETNVLVDFTDLLTTFADVAQYELPDNWNAHGTSFAPLLRNDPNWQPRDWIFAQLKHNWWVRGDRYRLNRDGRLFDMSDEPFSMREIRPENDTPESAAARASLQAVLDELDPASGPTYEAYMDSEYDSAVWDWKKQNFGWAESWDRNYSGDDSDPDGDGVTNIFERAFGWDPNNGTDAMPKVTMAADGSGFAIPQIAPDANVVISVVNADGSPAQPGASLATLRYQAERATPWKMPRPLPEDRPEVVR